MTRWQIMTCIHFFGKGAPHILYSPFNGLYHTTCTCLKIRMTSIFQLSILKKPHERCFKLVLLENLSWRAALFSFFKAAAKWAIFFISDQIEFIFRVLPYSLVPQTPPQNTQGSFNNYVKKKTVVSRKSMYVKCPQLSIRGGRWAKLSKIWSTYLLNDPQANVSSGKSFGKFPNYTLKHKRF